MRSFPLMFRVIIKKQLKDIPTNIKETPILTPYTSVWSIITPELAEFLLVYMASPELSFENTRSNIERIFFKKFSDYSVAVQHYCVYFGDKHTNADAIR